MGLVIGLGGTVLILAALNLPVFLGCLVVAVGTVALYALTGGLTTRYNQGLNDEHERQVLKQAGLEGPLAGLSDGGHRGANAGLGDGGEVEWAIAKGPNQPCQRPLSSARMMAPRPTGANPSRPGPVSSMDDAAFKKLFSDPRIIGLLIRRHVPEVAHPKLFVHPLGQRPQRHRRGPSCKWMFRRPPYRTNEGPPTNPYTTTFSTSISSLSTPRTSPPVTSRIRNLGGVSTCPSHSPSGEMTVYGDPSSG